MNPVETIVDIIAEMATIVGLIGLVIGAGLTGLTIWICKLIKRRKREP